MHDTALIVAAVAGAAGGYIVGRCHQAVRYWIAAGRKLRRDWGSFRHGPRL